MKKEIGSNGSYFQNNFVHRREGDSMIIETTPDEVICRLNGYAIIPIEEYIELTGSNDFTDGYFEAIKNFNEKLKP